MRPITAVLALAILAAGCADDDETCLVADTRLSEPPRTLGETGLHCQSGEVAEDALSFAPSFELWSDGVQKRRWIHVPEDAVIDTTDMDHWSFPKGTRIWKEFADERGPLETRYAQRVGWGDDDWSFVSYRWRDDGSDADLAPVEGEPNVRGTGHDIPSSSQCGQCHGKTDERVLGLSALQRAPETLRAQLSDEPPADVQVPGDDVERAALGYLHANCGHCHHEGERASAPSLRLALRAGLRTVEETPAHRSTVGVTTDMTDEIRISPGRPEESLLWLRMTIRGAGQMPPVGTERIDPRGSDALAAWIRSLPH